MKRSILVATQNDGKVREYADILNNLEVSWFGLDTVGLSLNVEETGKTFEENAIIKAMAYANASGMLTLADDSGLEVDILKGAPGVQTARYGGINLSSQERYQLLLKAMEDVPMDKRTARFRCVVALASSDGLLGTAAGSCEGLIALKPVGSGGFGYDPIFFLPDKGLTMAQLSPAEKHRISHRGRALAGIAPLLRKLLATDPERE